MAEEARKRTGAGPATDDDREPSGDGAGSRDDAPEGSAPSREEGGERTARGTDSSNGGKRSGGEGFDHPTAPSLGPNTVIEREPVEERLARHDQSPVDAMGLDKRRHVVAQSYGPSKKRQLALYGIALGVAAAILVGLYLLVGALDKPVGNDVKPEAPWAQPNAPQHPPKPLQ